MCFKKILHSNQNYNDYNCVFAVPKFVFGLPLYNIVECCGFLIEKLIAKGFEVYLAIPTTLHISWKPKDSINKNYNTRPQLKYYNSEYKSNTKQPELLMYKHKEIQKPEATIPPMCAVRVNNARQKKQDNYDKLTSRAF